MKVIKTISFVLAAVATMAIVGASSATAESTALCKVDENACAAGSLAVSAHQTTVSGSPAQILTSAGSLTCEFLLESTSVGALAAPQIIKGKFTYSNCKRNGTEGCTVAELNGPIEISILKEGHETAAFTFKGEINLKCGSFINCTYNGTGLKGTAKGPLLSSKTNGSIELSEQSMNHVSGLFCPATAKLDITTTPLVATYIAG